MTIDRRRRRQHWLRIHSTLALSLGLLFVLIGFTGSLNVVGPELDRWLNPELSVTARPGAERSPDTLMAAVKAAHPRRFGAWRLQFPESPDRPAIAWYDKPVETSEESYAPLMVALDPYTGKILANRFWGHTSASWIYRLHSQWLLGGFGRTLVGLTGLAWLVSLVTGLRLGLPGRHRLRQALTLKSRASFKRRIFDLHRVAGIYSLPLLLTAVLTGLHLAFPTVLTTAIGAADFGHHEAPEAEEIAGSTAVSGTPLNLAQAILMARGLFPNAAVDSVTTPRASNGLYRVDFRRPGEHHALTAVWVDPYSGQIRQARNSAHFGRGQRFVNAIRPLHNGSLLGAPGRTMAFLAGFVPFALFLTGIIHWLHKRRVEVVRYCPRLPPAWLRLWHRHGPQARGLASALIRNIVVVIAHVSSILIRRLRALWAQRQRHRTPPHG
ncbi:PepSY-associated TM helix domain-containing protein [Methylococcus geothermalis]|uniref:PepSY domain-containing protein n=1 Tax=Methylococcus geothermalis TaxID=2681310 RepID=A0A858QAA9_9GAMM|nr:PepSY-associated TM helix domain-containing protein [Methylococcus geothermalis]QJD30770.1 PepSY domain-containing protein [Methylococcus geothermalis]